jgi:hypothetical protein
MGLFTQIKNLFRENNLDNVFYVHEDDVRQIELAPAENLEYQLNQCKKIDDFSEEHFDGNGWTDMYVRKAPPITWSDKRISTNDFKSQFIENGFTEKELRYSGFTMVKRQDFALTFKELRIYCGVTNDFINSIYFDDYIKDEDKSLFNSVLGDLSNRYNLVLVNWWQREIFDTRSETEIKRFNDLL